MTGFYKRRRGILEHLESGTIGLLDLAIHDYLCLKINSVIGNNCSIPAGECFTSAAAIYAICPKEVSERTIRRSLEHLEALGWIRRWTTPGKHGNYPVLVARASVHDMSGKEYRVNAESTIDWRSPVYEPCEESASTRRGDVRLSRSKNRDSRKPYVASREALELTTLLKAKILGNNPTARITEGQLAKWAREADVMINSEERLEADIRANIEWSQRDDFWKRNILSMGKIRKHFDQLSVKRQHPPVVNGTTLPTTRSVPVQMLTAADCRPTH